MSEPVQQPLITLKENRFPVFSLILVVLAFGLAGWIAWLNYVMHQSATAQLLRSQQMQERAVAGMLERYNDYLLQQASNARFEQSFEIRQEFYARFMAGVSDVWLSTSRKDMKSLDNALNQMEKAYFGLEPFLAGGERHFLKKRMLMMQNMAKQLVDPRYEYQGNLLSDKKTLDQMSQDFQDFLYPVLFEPRKDGDDESNQTGE